MWARLVVLLLALSFAGAAHAATVPDRLEHLFQAGDGIAGTEEQAESLAMLEGFYRQRDMRPLWVDDRGASPRARQLATLLAQADFDALDPDDYGAGILGTLLAATDADLLAELDIRLSLGLVLFAADLGQGRTAPHVSDPELFVYRQEVDKAQVIAAAETADDLALFVDRYRPQSPRYDRLKVALADYRAMAELGGWSPIPDGPVLKPGMTDPRLGMVRRRLREWGDLTEAANLSADGEPDFYDDALVAAVERMQHRHGLEVDGVIGRNTLAAFNVPVADRIEQLVLNLERRRWLSDDLGRRHIFVNLADFNLKVVEDSETLFDTRVVVGQPYHRTPVFSHRMTYLEVNPYWHVPRSIARNELLPKIRADATFLARNTYTLLSDWSGSATVVDPNSVDWSALTPSDFNYKIRQEPGGGNALGRIKFMFPNRFNVYLHDTPAKSLFNRVQRTFSHGCIRVMDPLRLAELVLSETPNWPLERVNRTIASGRTTVVPLAEPLPIHISYLTAWANRDGAVHFRSDVYDRDVALADALMSRGRDRRL